MSNYGKNRQGGALSSAFVSHDPVDVYFDEPSRTRQEFAAECDINTLMARYEATGVISHINERQPYYFDTTGAPDLREAIDIVRDAERAFMSLPAKVRASFDNDAVAWVDYAQDPKNLEQMREWGLAPPVKPEAAPLKVEVVSTAPPPEGVAKP